jgi:hypothetical protein
MDAVEDLDFLAGRMADVETGWSLGTFGAIAEFTRDAGEPATLARGAAAVSAVTARGGIRIEAALGLRPFASESPTTESWSHRVALCLPQEACAMSRRTVLTEVGSDHDALRAEDRNAVLFDLGLGALQVDVCVRSADPDVIAGLRALIGQSVFAPGNGAMGVILEASPHRVFASRLGRIEVFQAIPPPDGRSPEGPHTHLLPKLLVQGRTHAATEPLPAGWVPCAHLYPPHPARDAFGHSQPFQPARHALFQEMLDRYGDPDLVALKRRVAAAVADGRGPSDVPVADDRFARATVRVALRQLRASDEAGPAFAAWLAAHERAGRAEVDEGAEPHHG